jgi:hypothetical protein
MVHCVGLEAIPNWKYISFSKKMDEEWYKKLPKPKTMAHIRLLA